MTGRSNYRIVPATLALAGGAAVLLASGAAYAQAADVRLIRPDVMLLLDTSGSMEWRVDANNDSCLGADGGPCNRCSDSNGASLLCSATCQNRNRWTTALEVLTGSIPSGQFTCTVGGTPRSYGSSMSPQPDDGYMIPYHQPLSGGQVLGTSSSQQNSDGILDSYADRVRFGLMTFDNVLSARTDQVGMWSYLAANEAANNLQPNGCMNPDSVNIGIRRAPVGSEVIPGGLISVGSPSADAATLSAINNQIQTSIVGIRPYGATPIAAMLSDALDYWTHSTDVTPVAANAGDPYYACRARFNILVSDGQPNMDFRPACESASGMTGRCPYDPATTTALNMASNTGTNPAVKTYVIAFNAGSTTQLDLIAAAGGTSASIVASSGSTLTSALSSVLDQIATQTSTRTAPAFGLASQGTSSNGLQYQFQSSFLVAAGAPWEGVLERRRSQCDTTTNQPVDLDITRAQDDFGYLLQSAQRTSHMWPTRRIWTYVPSGVTTATGMQAAMTRTAGAAASARTTIDTSYPTTLMGPAVTVAQRSTYVSWLRGDASDQYRATRPLGSIYHSNPLVVAPPTTSLPDQTFAAYRSRALATSAWRTSLGTPAITVGTREPIVYVGTNDGILHAFNADTGEEVWGFVPPYLSGTIPTMYPATHVDGVDGSPVAREVVYTRSPTALGDANSWHTVVIVGLRGGGGAYVALDVTDPYDPHFLWQFTDPGSLINAYGMPAIGTVYSTWGSAMSTRTERAIALLPGGQGHPLPAASCSATATTGLRPAAARSDNRLSVTSGSLGGARTQVHCYGDLTGQYLYAVDVETGSLIRRFGPTGSPIIGSPSMYIGTEGGVATRAYVGDADGAVWRLDMSDPDPANWQFAIGFDSFSNASYSEGQPVVAAPVVSIDRNGDTLIAVGSGDPDLLEGTERNRIALYREHIDFTSGGTVGSGGIAYSNVWQLAYRAGLNPSDGLNEGERLTGAMSLFNGVLYFGTFVPSSNPNDLCTLGYSRLWGMDLTQIDTSVSGATVPLGRLAVDPAHPTTSTIVRVTTDLNGNGIADDSNTVLFGVGISRQPSCATVSSTSVPYGSGSRDWVESIAGGEFRLVAQTGRGGVSAGLSRTNTVVRPLQPPMTQTRVDSWAAVVE